MKKIFLNKFASKKSSNVDNNIAVDLSTERKLMPSDSISETIDSYSEYVKEKDKSNIYRLMFTINPVCTNILFNGITEVVYKEGSDEAKVYTEHDVQRSSLNEDAVEYASKYDRNTVNFTKDTAYTHPNLGGYKYHCGLDIFNNHMLRKKEFAVVNDCNDTNGEVFNTLEDYLRDSSGKIVEEKIIKTEGTYSSNNNLAVLNTKRHLYTKDSSMSFQETFTRNLVESDGWVGFINPVSLDIPNVTIGDSQYTVNKCMNDASAGAFIDMYPGRELYSFNPIMNQYRRRLEKNWDYCLTYPYAYDNTNPLIYHYGINGIKCKIESDLSDTIFENENRETGLVYLKTQISNTFQKGDSVNFCITQESTGKTARTDYPLTVESVGYLGEDTKHYFSVELSELYTVFSVFASGNGTAVNVNDFDIRVVKVVNGRDCEYYVRKFRKIPNFNGENICVEDGVTEDEIASASKEFSSSINKLAFSENVFSDKITQILYDEDVVLTGLRDELNRPLSEIYLTIVKRNAGHDIWYGSNNTSRAADEKVEFSHCFGKITSGFDLESGETDYNVRYLCPVSGTPIEDDITIDNDEFIGDIVEFSANMVSETVLEEIYHRFNTVQRDGGFAGAIYHDEIVYDDYDVSGNGFTVETKEYDSGNTCYEGYYYKPHYRIPIRQYDGNVKQGSHKKIIFSSTPQKDGNVFSGITSINYYLSAGDVLYFYNKESGERLEGKVLSATGRSYTNITFTASGVSDITLYNTFKKNTEMPDYAIDLYDATGRYLWREPLSDSGLTIGDELYDSIFTNGAHYRHLNINFYLRRQDPTGEYGLNTISTLDFKTGAAEGKIKDISFAEYEEEKTNDIC